MRTQITPSQAADILESHNKSNRRISPKAVKFISKQLTDGLWAYNGQSIVIGADGNLLDGQHRLSACVDSGVTLDTEIVHNVPNESFTTMDSGKVRSGADCFVLKGYKQTSMVAAVMKLCVLFSRLENLSVPFVGNSLSSDKIPTGTLMATYEAINKRVFFDDEYFASLNEYITFLCNVSHQTGRKQASYVFASLITYIINKEKSLAFTNHLTDGLFSNKNSPGKRFNDYTLAGSHIPVTCAKGGAAAAAHKACIYFKAWNTYCDNSTITALRVSTIYISPLKNNICRGLPNPLLTIRV